MNYNEITEEMWDKIEAEGIVVLRYDTDYDNGRVNFVINYSFDEEADYWPHNGDELYSDLVERLEQGAAWGKTWSVVNRPTSTVKSATKDPIVEWLHKYVHVFNKTQELDTMKVADDGVYLFIDHGDIQGTRQVVEFINNRYELLQKEAKSNKQKELAEKKAKLLEELSAIDKELEGI